jgi:endo-1,4-beta-mannosidase
LSHPHEDAWRVDYLLGQAAEKDIYLLITTMDFSRFMAGEWAHNLYNTANGGPCADPWDFWTDEIPKQYYRQVLRYFVARWGYSTNVLAWELWNEWHELEWHTSQFNVAEGIAWHQEMGAYLKSLDSNHMVTTSMGSFDAYDNLWNLLL